MCSPSISKLPMLFKLATGKIRFLEPAIFSSPVSIDYQMKNTEFTNSCIFCHSYWTIYAVESFDSCFDLG